MHNQPLVSIIIPTFNRGHLIGETLDSILSQTYLNWECLVIDDGSSDKTPVIVNKFIELDHRFKYHKRPNNLPQGGNAARNYGFELSKGEYIQWFDDDDLMLPDYLKLRIERFENKYEFVICTGCYFNDEITNGPINISINTYLFKDYALFRSKIFTPSVLLRKSFLINKDLFNINMHRGQETEFFSRIFYEIVEDQYKIINQPLFLYRQHDETKTKQNEHYNAIFKTSEIYVTIENLKRGLQLEDQQMVPFFYRVLVNFLFRAIENQDKSNAKYILKTLMPILKPINYNLAIQLNIVGKSLLKIGRSIYKIEMYFKTYKLYNV